VAAAVEVGGGCTLHGARTAVAAGVLPLARDRSGAAGSRRGPDGIVTGHAAPLVPGWLVRSAAVGWRVGAIAGVLIVGSAIAYAVPLSVTATLVSLVLAAALAPTTARLRRAGMSHAVAAAISFAAGAVLVLGALAALAVVLVPDLLAVSSAVEEGLQAVGDRLVEGSTPNLVAETLASVAASIHAALDPDLAALVGSAASFITVLVLGTFLTYFLLADGDRGWRWAVSFAPADRAPDLTTAALDGLLRVARYVRRTAVLAMLDGLVVWVVLTVAGVPLAGALAAVAFLAGFVPYIGAVMGGATVILATLALGGAGAAAAVTAGLVLAWILGTRALERTTMSRDVDVNPVLVLVALPAGIALFGILGLLALLPVTVFLLAISRSVVAALDLTPAGAGGDGGTSGGSGEASVHGPLQGLAPAPPEDAVPRWLDRLAQWSWRLLVLAALAWLAISAVEAVAFVVVPAIIAMVAVATLLSPVDRLAARGRMARGAAIALASGIVLAFMALVIGAAIAMSLGPLREVAAAAAAGAQDLGLAALRDAVMVALSGLEVDILGLAASAAGLVLGAVLAALLTFFLLRDGRTWWRGALARVAPPRRRPLAAAGRLAVTRMGGYMVGTAIISAFGGITSGLIMVFLGLPLAVPIAVLGFFAGFIPYVGSFLSTALALLVTIALGTTTDIVVMLVFTVVFNIAQGNFVTPLVYGKSLALHPAVVLMAIPVGNEIAGVLGMFLVVPFAAIVAATWRLVVEAIDPPAAMPAGASDAGGSDTGATDAGASDAGGSDTGAGSSRPAGPPDGPMGDGGSA
jgi:putative heme transporter